MTAVEPEIREEKEAGGDYVSRVACRIFRERGYHATSMRAISSALGWQPAALYYYYDSKEDLLFRIMENAVDTLTTYVQAHVDPDATATERLRQAVTAHVTLTADHLDELSVFLHELKSLSPKRREIIQAKGARYEHVFRDILREGVISGEFARVDVRLARYMVLSVCNWLYNWYNPDGAYLPEAIAGAFCDMLLNGLRKSAVSESR